MKRVVVITECRRFVMNFGETLQAVALNRAITKLGYQCFTASYEDQKGNFNGWFKNHIKDYGIRGVKFELFRLRNMRYPIMRSNQKEEFEKVLEDADMVVCGSDCIWYEKCYNSIMFLHFPKNKIPKIAYAPSLRDNVITDPMYERKVARWIKDFSFLSTREKAGSRLIEKISGRNVETVLDPTLLLSKKEWNQMCSKKVVKEPYVVMYIIGKSRCMRSIISQVQTHYKGRKLLWITMENNDGYSAGEGLVNVGPAEFLSLIRYADAVVTDSFHGSAFSIIYEKQFYAIKRIVDENDVYDHDCRIKNIFEILDINNYFSREDKINFQKSQIDYDNVRKKLSAERKKSVEYLKKSLNGKEESYEGNTESN